MRVNVKKLIELLEEEFDDEAEIVIGSGQREYPAVEIMKKIPSGDLVVCTEGYANWKRKKQMVL